MIRLAGLEVNKNIKITFTGLRPGEKLFEELKLEGEGMKPTPHEKIHVFEGGTVPIDRVPEWLQDLSSLVDSRNTHGLVAKLVSIVPEYWPSDRLALPAEPDNLYVALHSHQTR